MDLFLTILSGIAFWGGIIIAAVIALFLAILYRRVVPTNMVHIVQYVKNTTSFGTGYDDGNVYYAWPKWVPMFGVEVIELPVSNFDLTLSGYEAYDKDRVPFVVDVTSFFRIKDTNIAAQRVASIDELEGQLKQIVQGSVRKILASDVIDSIMLERSKFGDSFTEEVQRELEEWGVEPVKNMELMDIRDSGDSRVIDNIMAKKKSEIEMESRKVVADNQKQAQIAEIEAQQITDIRAQEAEQKVGERTAEKDKKVGIADELAQQEIKEQQAVTAEKDMAVNKVNEVRAAEIEKEKQVVAAQQDKETTVIIADGQLEETKKQAEGIKVEGAAKADAEKLMLLAPVDAQIKLAEKIAELPEYMQYLLGLEAVGASEKVGVEQAAALAKGDLKVIANSGSTAGGVNNLMDIFSPAGGTSLTGALTALAQSGEGQALLERFGVKVGTDAPAATSDVKADNAKPNASSDTSDTKPKAEKKK